MSQSLPPDIKGDPSGVTGLGAAMRGAAEQISAVQQQLVTTGLDGWLSSANHAYQGVLTEHLHPRLGTAGQVLDQIGGEIQGFAARLEQYQSAHEQYKGQVEDAQRRLATAQAQSSQSHGFVSTLEHSATHVAETTLHDAEHAAEGLAQDAEQIAGEIAKLVQQAWDNFERYTSDAEHVAEAVGDAIAHVSGIVLGAVGKVLGTIGSGELLIGSALFGVAKDAAHVGTDGYDIARDVERWPVKELDDHWEGIRRIVEDAAPVIGIAVAVAMVMTMGPAGIALALPVSGLVSAGVTDSVVAGDLFVGRGSNPDRSQRRFARSETRSDIVDGAISTVLAIATVTKIPDANTFVSKGIVAASKGVDDVVEHSEPEVENMAQPIAQRFESLEGLPKTAEKDLSDLKNLPKQAIVSNAARSTIARYDAIKSAASAVTDNYLEQKPLHRMVNTFLQPAAARPQPVVVPVPSGEPMFV